MRFLADMGVSITTVQALRAAAHDAVHLRDEGLIRLPDPDIVAKAAHRAKGRAYIRSGFRRHSCRGAHRSSQRHHFPSAQSDTLRREPEVIPRDQ